MKSKWEEDIKEVHEDWMLTEENGSHNWDGKATNEIIRITKRAIQQAITNERKRILDEINNEIEEGESANAVADRIHIEYEILWAIINKEERNYDNTK